MSDTASDENSVCIAELNQFVARTIYAPLSEGQTRFVRIHPRRCGKRISCSVFNASLHSPPTYQALSYVWGEQTRPRRIRFNGRPFSITRNLYDALVRLRKADEDLIVWIDALAINQSDIPERNSQVQMMRRIYFCAQETLIWLHKPLELVDSELWGRLCEEEHELRGREIADLVSDLIDQEYWYRVWTAQEVMYSRRATLVTQIGTAPFDILVTLADLLTATDAGYLTEEESRQRCGVFRNLCLACRPSDALSGSSIDFDTWVKLRLHRECLDPKDQVFGFLGCFPREVQSRVDVNYFLGMEEVLKGVTCAFLETADQNLSFLARSNYFDNIASTDLPSWVPSLHNAAGDYWGQMMMMGEPHSLRQDDGGVAPSYYQILDHRNILHVKGIWSAEVGAATAKPLEQDAALGRGPIRFMAECLRELGVDGSELESFGLALNPKELAQSSIWAPEITFCLGELVDSLAAGLDDLESKIQNLAASYDEGLKDSYWWEVIQTVRMSIVRLRPRHRRGNSPIFGLTWRKEARTGDRVCSVHGCPSPLLLRPQVKSPGGREEYKLIGSIILPTATAGGIETLDDVFLC